MAKFNEQTEKLTKFSCISCEQEFEVYSTLKQDSLKIDVCGDCLPFYTGSSSMSMKTGRIEDFKRRERKTQQKQAAK